MPDYLPLKTPLENIVIHCAATPPKMDIGVREIDQWHRSRGFAQIGYHAVIRRDGKVEAGRPMSAPGAHTVGHNRSSLAVCLVGGVKSLPEAQPEANFTEAQMRSLSGLLKGWLKEHPTARVVGHRELTGTPGHRLKACPSFDVQKWLDNGQPENVRPFGD